MLTLKKIAFVTVVFTVDQDKSILPAWTRFFFNNFLFPSPIKNKTNNKTQELFIYKKK